MSVFGAMRTSITGMAAQSSRLSTVADNIANSSTTGYKRATNEFETVLGNNNVGTYVSGGVVSHTRVDVVTQGTIQQSTRATDLAIQGEGFFAVSDNGGATYLTRAGSFVTDSSGNLVNTAGFKLLGYKLNGSDDTAANASLAGLEPVMIDETGLVAAPTTSGRFTANLPSEASAVTGSRPSSNAADATYTAKSSLVAYDNLGAKKTLDVYLTKTGDNAWEMSVYDSSQAASGGGFPYSGGALASAALTFDGSNGKITAPETLSIPVPNGQATTIALSGMTQLAASFGATDATTNGNAPSQFDHLSIGTDGIVSKVYASGAKVDMFKVPLANVTSPDNLEALSGNVFAETSASGHITLGAPTTGNLGKLVSSSLESSTVDLATELTTMIESQRSYSANSQVFQTGSEMLQQLLSIRS